MRTGISARFNWEDVRTFIGVADHGSLSAAARALGVTHATVARRIEDLEAALGGGPLFERSRLGYALTAAGHASLAEARAMAVAAEGVAREAIGADEMAGLVRVSATATIADRKVAPALAALTRDHPRLQIEIAAEDRNVSLALREADIAVRLGRPASGDAVTRKIGSIRYRLFGTPDYIGMTQPENRRIFTFARPAGGATLPRIAADLARGREAGLTLPSFAAQAACARMSGGLAMLPDYLAEDIAGLIAADDEPDAEQQEVWLVTHRDAAKFRRVRVVLDSIVGAFASQ